MKRIPIITSVESKLRFPVKELSEASTANIFSYDASVDVQSKQVRGIESYEQVATRSCAVGLSGYVHIGFSSSESGRMYILKVPLQTAFLATYVECQSGSLEMAMAISLS